MLNLIPIIMENFLFRESKYDFDHILEQAGYKVTKDYETSVTFSKQIEVSNDHSSQFKSIEPFSIEVTRPKILNANGKGRVYEICSPYRITFVFGVVPLYAIRRMQWDTFPGEMPDVFDTILKIAEAEAKICAYNFMETDTQIIQKLKEFNEIKQTEN